MFVQVQIATSVGVLVDAVFVALQAALVVGVSRVVLVGLLFLHDYFLLVS